MAEGASAIVHHDTDHAADMARAQSVRASDLQAADVVDRIVPMQDVAEAHRALQANETFGKIVLEF